MESLKFSVKTLSCGLQVVLVPMPSVGSVTSLVLANTGSRYENSEKEGIAHFFEHIVFKGTDKFPTALALSSTIDAIGAEFNAFTSKEYTGYYVKSASKHVGTALDVLSDMLLRPNLNQADIDREKGVIIEEINMYRDNPMSHVSTLFDHLFFVDRGLSHDIIGSKETVSSINSQDFEKFLESWYGLPNLVLILAGDQTVVSDARTLELIENLFTKSSKGKRIAQKALVSDYFSAESIGHDNLLVEFKQTEQAHLVMGWPGIARGSSDRYALSLLSVVMGANMSSRLFTEVREKRGLCYYVRSDSDYYHNTGVVGASAGVDPKRVYEAIEVIRNEFQAVVDDSKPISADELSRAKEYIAGMTVLSLEDSESVAQYFGSKQLLLNTIESPQTALEKMQKVTLEEVTALAKKLFSQKLKLAVIGPFKDKQKFASLIE